MNNNKTTLILVDDDEAHTVLIKRSLKKSGLRNEIISLQSGQQALDFIFSEGEFAGKIRCASIVVILDINMPGISGVSVLKKLKQSEITRHIPVIMLTTTDEPKEIDECYKIGCNAYITKPVKHTDFVEKMAELGLFLKVSKMPGFG